MVHFSTTLKPTHNNLNIEKDTTSLTCQTQETCFEMKKMKKEGNFGSKEETLFNSTSNSNYKALSILKTNSKSNQKTKSFPLNPIGTLMKKNKIGI